MQICYLDVHIIPLGITVLTVVILELVSFSGRQERSISNLAVTVFVSVEVVQRFTLMVRVWVGSVIVTLTCAIPDAIVTEIGVLGAIVSCAKSSLSSGKASHRLGGRNEKVSVTVLFGAMIVLMIVEVWFLSSTDVVQISGGVTLDHAHLQ